MIHVIANRVRLLSCLLMLILASVIIFLSTISLVPQSIDESNYVGSSFGIVISEAKKGPAPNPIHSKILSDGPKLDVDWSLSLGDRDSKGDRERVDGSGRRILKEDTSRNEKLGSEFQLKKRSTSNRRQEEHEDLKTVGKVSLDEGLIGHLLSLRYKLRDESSNCSSNNGLERSSKTSEQEASKCDKSKGGDDCDNKLSSDDTKSELPRPTDVTVQIIHWYPPVLGLNWSLNELTSSGELKRMNFYNKISLAKNDDDFEKKKSNNNSNKASDIIKEFDLDSSSTELDMQSIIRLSKVNPNNIDEENSFLNELKLRRFLVQKSLTCFQVIYNVVNSR